MHLMSSLLGRLNRQRGQAIILFAGLFAVIVLAGAIVIDFGLWFSERRGAQKDSDLSSLAGAWEYALWLGTGSVGTPPDGDAATKAQEWFDSNNQADNASIVNLVASFPCVTVDSRHDSRSLFAGIFGIGAPDIGARAVACAGALTGVGDVLPLETALNGQCFTAGEPDFGELCGLEFGAPSGPARGLVDLRSDGTHCSESGGPMSYGEIVRLMVEGAEGSCFINEGEPPTCAPDRRGPWFDCVAVQTGNAQAILDGIEARIGLEPVCDTSGDGIDSFDESVVLVDDGGDITDLSTNIYEARDCGGETSPRLVTIIVLPREPPRNAGNRGFPIAGFAGFYLWGCAPEAGLSEAEVVDRKCDAPRQVGLQVVYGNFVNLIVAGGQSGPPGGPGTQFTISLVE